MNLIKNIFNRSKAFFDDGKRDKINPQTIRVGTILRVYEGKRSYSRFPYDVIVLESTDSFFKTELVNSAVFYDPHIRTFDYGVWEWANYHSERFKIIQY